MVGSDMLDFQLGFYIVVEHQLDIGQEQLGRGGFCSDDDITGN
jgi:hypothetical protein